MIVIRIIEIDGFSITPFNRAVIYIDVFGLKFFNDTFKISGISFEGKV
jgi:hypothetical protein